MAPLPDWIYRQSAVLPFRRRDGALEVLLITTRGGKRWGLPKGIVDPGMTPGASAAKEAAEVAGVAGEVWLSRLGRYRRDKWGGTCSIEVFPMEVTDERADWPEASTRKRAWLSPAEAAKRLAPAKLRRLVDRLPKALKDGPKRRLAADDPALESPRLVYLLRHANAAAAEPGQNDADRPLSPRGRSDLEAMGHYAQMADVQPDLILCSSATRARQTLDAMRPALGEDASAKYEQALYGAGPDDLVKRLRRAPAAARAVMLVGHNPAMQALAAGLVGEGDRDGLARLAAGFPAGGLAILVLLRPAWKDIAAGTCELHSLVGPGELA